MTALYAKHVLIRDGNAVPKRLRNEIADRGRCRPIVLVDAGQTRRLSRLLFRSRAARARAFRYYVIINTRCAWANISRHPVSGRYTHTYTQRDEMMTNCNFQL